jgi:NTP pyrophosphatase (non-canonical NTP hydrolase)
MTDANTYRELYEKIARSTPAQGSSSGPLYRVLKLQEEVGEVAEAVIGFVGANKRKGFTSEDLVPKELADVVITAMVALHDWVPSPTLYLRERMNELDQRIEQEGS